MHVNLDPTRIIHGVITGVGFLGAGSIMRTEGYVHGLTTAASVWMVAAIGVAVGVHAYSLAVIGTVLALIVLEGFRWVERFLSPEVIRTAEPMRPRAALVVLLAATLIPARRHSPPSGRPRRPSASALEKQFSAALDSGRVADALVIADSLVVARGRLGRGLAGRARGGVRLRARPLPSRWGRPRRSPPPSKWRGARSPSARRRTARRISRSRAA